MDANKPNQQSNKKPFKHTKDLVNLAIKDGWTQKEIADSCRTQQSIVSSWKKGTKQGTEQQLTPLLKQYGAKLRRQTFKVYRGIDNKTGSEKYYKVEGPVILSFLACKQRIHRAKEARYSNETPGKFFKSNASPHSRFIIQYQGGDNYTLIFQQQMYVDGTPGNYHENEGIWVSYVHPCQTPHMLLQMVDEHIKKSDSIKSGSDVNELAFNSYLATLPFLTRQALLNNGVPVEELGDIEVIEAQW